jgi:hypothetical protein
MKISNPESHTAPSGAGGCHSGLFGRTTIHMAPEGDGGGGGGSAASASTAAAASGTTTSTTQSTGANSAKLFTQEEVNTIVGERVARVKSEQQVQAAPPAAQVSSSATKADLAAELAEMRRKAEFADHVADYSIPRERRGDLYDLFKAQNPSDPVQWFATKAPIFGATAASASTTTTSNNTNGANAAQVETKPPPAASTTAPARVDIPTNGGLVDILSLTPQQIDQLGPAGLREIHERNVTAGRQQHGAPSLPRAVLAQKR